MGNLEKALQVRAEKEAATRERRDEQLRDMSARMPGASVAGLLVALKKEYPREYWNKNAVVKAKARIGITTGGDAHFHARKAAQQDGAQQIEQDDEPAEAWRALLGWSVLRLFDNLREKFIAEEDRDPDTDSRLTWIAWRVFLAAVFGLPQAELTAGHEDAEYPGVDNADVPRGAANIPKGASTQEIYTLCTGRTVWPTVIAKIVALIVGRRGGKSYITAVIGIYLACCRRYIVNLGTKPMVMILARDREQAGTIRNYIREFLHALEETRGMIANETLNRIELANGVCIEVRAVSDSGAGTRGYTNVAVLADEIAFWPTDSTSKKQDRSVLRALRPSMFGVRWRTETTHGTGALIVLLSSPYSKRGVLFEYWLAAYGKEQDANARPVLAWQADTLSMRPEQDRDLLQDITDEYEEDPENAKAEYGGHWRSDLEAIFSKEALEKVCAVGVFERPYVASHSPYRAFIDPSGNSRDSYVVAIAHDEEREENGEKFNVAVLDKVEEWIPKFDPQGVSADVANICKSYRIASATGDAYGGDWPRDPIRKRGVEYVLCEKNRSELYLDLLPVMNSGRCVLLDASGNKQMKRGVNQFSNLERRTGRSGKDAVDHPSGSHDDVANAIAGALVGSATVTYRIRRPTNARA